MEASAQPAYPAHWEADVVLRDGGTAHIRPITPDDAERLVSFYERVSDESKFYRFFAPYPRLSDRDVHRFTHHDYVDRVGLAATVGDAFLATVRYDRIDRQGRAASLPADRAEVAFLVEDAHQGRGLASTLLEHIAAVARERGVRRFEAEVLPANRKMIKVFTDAGYSQSRSYADGAVHLTLDLAPTAESLAVMRAREQRAEARSVHRLLTPGSVAVVGAGRHPGGAGRTVLAGLLAGGFTGRLAAVNRELPPETKVLGGVPAFRSVREILAPVDLAVLAVPAAEVAGLLDDCAERGVQGLVVMAAGHSPGQQRELVRRARARGMRIVGPNAFGVINTAPDTRLNASPAPRLPAAGRIGLFTQSAPMGIAVLDELESRGGGLSTFVSAGNRADVSGNDVLQYWHDDERTRVALLYLESVGNPRKFTRLARRTAQAGKPVVVVRGGRHSGGAPPLGHIVPASQAPEETVAALLGQAGVIQADTAVELVDIGLLLAQQPLPGGPRVAVLGNAQAVALSAHDACRAQRLRPLPLGDVRDAADAAEFGSAVAAALADPGADAVLVALAPTVAGAVGPDELAAALRAASAGARGDKPVVVAQLALDELAREIGARSIPTYPSAERAARALAQAVRHAEWLAGAESRGRAFEFPDLDKPAAARLLAEVAGQTTARDTPLSPEATAQLLASYGIELLPSRPAPTAAEAVAAAEALGYPVALKATAPRARHRATPGSVRLDLATEAELRRAYRELTERLGDPSRSRPTVQRMAPRGVDTVVRATVDPAIGAVLSFGLAGPASELLGDVAHRLIPVTDRDVAGLVRAIRAAPILFGWRGSPPVDTEALEALLGRLGRLVDDHPQIGAVELDPVVVAERGSAVLSATVRVAPPPPRPDLGPRRLPAY
ncbi:GNAT family N-acetyltransferase [Streptomyces sp. 3MP-14]|uniref:GNAT family N-acetyltransferase n=1 Tax=Streptomyces mimosae TaxID=2586635 RepID=A0A5N6AID1_9ACTN|nr:MULTISPECIES: GNAT family N-acetyltransferase [Streptomyces]KAB8167912.1 GNAT family N-acetyltransferase [Streptomyces mimosae]KAB8177440.1 GNAT family N-acetyltransferase [Streptomyces sp. 3MP-14]